MIICKDGCYSYTGATAAEAYSNYLDAKDDHQNLDPTHLQWFSAQEMALNMSLAAKPKTTAKNKVA